jgi:cell division protein FtsB
LQTQVAALIDDQTRLKAECQARQAENSVLAVECDSLKAEVERLTKAGDAMAEQLDLEYLISQPARLWRAAKEGKQS